MKPKLKLKRKYRLILLFILLLIMIFSTMYIGKELLFIKKDKNLYQEINEYFHDNDSNKNDNLTEDEIKINKINELHKQYKDIVGFIEIPDTDISYPLLKSTDNSFYLTHNYKGEYSQFGSIFIDKDAYLNISDNVIIYGHHNKNGLMFSLLTKYKNKDFYLNHKFINITTLDSMDKYEIIAIFPSQVYTSNDVDVFKYYYFINANNEEDFDEFVSNIKKLSLFDIEKTAHYGDKLITLSTCSDENGGRFVVVAKKL